MSDTNRYGRIVSGHMVEMAVKAALEYWIDDYLGEMERLEGYKPGAIERPRGVVTASEFAKMPEDQVPCILVISSDAANTKKHQQGKYEATWAVGVAPIVSDVDEIETRQLAQTYAAACRAALVQHGGLRSLLHPTGFGCHLQWVGEGYTDKAFNTTRTLETARAIFAVTVEDVVTQEAGPREPTGKPSEDPGPWPALVPPVHVVVDPQKLDSEVFV